MSENGYGLVIGDKNYSSWSLRPWLAMRRFAIPFTEINVDIYGAGARERILKHSPSAKVPALKFQGRVIWDTMAILETLAERHPEHPWWPADAMARATARSIAAEMHSGFTDLRTDMPMDLLHDKRGGEISEGVRRDISRIVEIWKMCRSQYGAGDGFLFGDFSIADAMYAPVATRFRTYVGDLAPFGDDGTCSAYVETVFSMPEMDEWTEGARLEPERRGRGDRSRSREARRTEPATRTRPAG